MDVETWKALWQFVFITASVLFYGIVTAVAYKAFGDVVRTIRNMAAGRGASESAADSQHE